MLCGDLLLCPHPAWPVKAPGDGFHSDAQSWTWRPNTSRKLSYFRTQPFSGGILLGTWHLWNSRKVHEGEWHSDGGTQIDQTFSSDGGISWGRQQKSTVIPGCNRGKTFYLVIINLTSVSIDSQPAKTKNPGPGQVQYCSVVQCFWGQRTFMSRIWAAG